MTCSHVPLLRLGRNSKHTSKSRPIDNDKGPSGSLYHCIFAQITFADCFSHTHTYTLFLPGMSGSVSKCEKEAYFPLIFVCILHLSLSLASKATKKNFKIGS